MKGLFDKKDTYIIIIFLGLVILFFGQVLFTQATYIYRDICHTFYPTRYFISQCLKDGHFPLWNPYLYFGFPFFGSLQHGLLNPLSFLMYILPFNFGFKLFIISHFCLSGIFMYLLMRDWGIGKSASLVSALVYTFNGYLLSIDIFTHLTSACWTPLIFLYYNRALNSGKFRDIGFTSIGLSLQFLGEKPEILYSTILTLILFTIANAIVNYKECKKMICFGKGVFIFGLVGAISMGLGLIQLLPFLEAVNSSYRQAGVEYDISTKWSLPPLELLTLICPVSSGFVEFIWKFFGQDFFRSIYMGIIGIFLVGLSLFERRKRNVFWTAIFLGSIILALGINTPFYRLFYEYFPGFSFFRYPSKFFCLTIFAGSILAGLGFENLLKVIKEHKIKALVFLFVVNLLLLVILIFWYINLERILFIFKLHYFSLSTIDELLASEGKYFMVFKNFLLVVMFFSLFNFLILLTKKTRISLNIFSIASIIIIIADLFFFGLNLNPLVNQKFYAQIPPILKILKKDFTYYRFLIEPKTAQDIAYVKNYTLLEYHRRHQLLLGVNTGLMYKLSNAQGYGFLFLKDYSKFNDNLKSGEFFKVQKLLNLTNVRYVISNSEIPTNQLKLIYMDKRDGQEYRLYENPTYLPRTFFVPNARIVKDRQKILDLLTSKDFDTREEVILEEEEGRPKTEDRRLKTKDQRPKIKEEDRNVGQASCLPSQTENRGQKLEVRNQKSEIENQKSKIKIVEYQPNKVAIQTSCSDDGFLFLSDTYYPGWKAYVDGKETKIYRANFLFRAIVLPKGNHRVEFIYFPLSFKIGVLGTSVTIISLLGFLITKKSKRKDNS